MDIYIEFASVYDDFIAAPYADWAKYIEDIWYTHGAKPRLVLDLACGTGSLTCLLSDKGYDMIGIDVSAEMLAIARQKDAGILWLQQDMREFELYGTVDAIVCICDGINYLTDEIDLTRVFALVRNYLNPSGLFVFDINSEYKYANTLANNTFASIGESAAYIWENFYDANERINEYDITFFAKDGEGAEYHRFDETHIQRAYNVEEIKSALKGADLEYLAHYGELTLDTPKPDEARIFFVAKK